MSDDIDWKAKYEELMVRSIQMGFDLRQQIAELRDDARRWRHARMILPFEAIEKAQAEFVAFGLPADEAENLRADAAIDAAMEE